MASALCVVRCSAPTPLSVVPFSMALCGVEVLYTITIMFFYDYLDAISFVSN